MTKNTKRPDRTEELPDRQEHMRKIALIRKAEHPQYAADDPTRTVNRPGAGYRPFDFTDWIFRIRKFH